MNIFEKAAREKTRFQSKKGLLSVEQVWDLPLVKGEVTLDELARSTNAELKSVTEDSFVVTSPDPRKPALEHRMEILKFIIAEKLADQKKAAEAKQRAERRKVLLDALEAKENEAIQGMSRDQILKELESL